MTHTHAYTSWEEGLLDDRKCDPRIQLWTFPLENDRWMSRLGTSVSVTPEKS